MVNFGEASFLQAADGVARTVGQWAHGTLGGFFQVFVPGGDGGGFEGLIIAARLEVDLYLLNPTTRAEMGESASIETRPAHDTAAAHLHMDNVPGILTHLPERLVVEGGVEVAILGAIGRLHGSQVNADDVGIGVFAGHIQSPDAGPTAQIHYPGAWRVRGIQQTVPVSGFGDDLMEDVEAVLLLIVAGQEIGPFAEPLVGAAVDSVPGVSSGTPGWRM